MFAFFSCVPTTRLKQSDDNQCLAGFSCTLGACCCSKVKSAKKFNSLLTPVWNSRQQIHRVKRRKIDTWVCLALIGCCSNMWSYQEGFTVLVMVLALHRAGEAKLEARDVCGDKKFSGIKNFLLGCISYFLQKHWPCSTTICFTPLLFLIAFI